MKKSEFLKRVEFIKDFLSKGFEDYMKEDITGSEFQDLMRLAVKLTPNYCVPFDDEEEDYEEAFNNAPNDCEMEKLDDSEIKMQEEYLYEFIDNFPNWDSSKLTLKGSNSFLTMFVSDYMI